MSTIELRWRKAKEALHQAVESMKFANQRVEAAKEMADIRACELLAAQDEFNKVDAERALVAKGGQSS